jgi:carboxyl-terminal processing protease
VVNAANFSSVEDYFYALLTPVLDSSGAKKDRFSFITSATSADSLSSGVGAGYGAGWVLDSANRIRIGQIEPNSPAAAAGLVRGGELIRGTTNPGSNLYPSQVGATLTFAYRPTPTSATRSVTMVATTVQEDPVPQVKAFVTASGKNVGYILFNAHTQGAQDKLITAVRNLSSVGLQSIVLDMRYNGGGFIYTALSLATMLSGTGSENKVFERLQYNDKRPQETASSTFIYRGALQVGETTYPRGFALPRLALPKVYVLTTGDTCSASESVINGLRGIDVEVVLIGGTTCGKPYGFARKDNCGLSYYPIEFQGTNAKGFSDYPSGFLATCRVADDFDRALGDPTEGLLSAALFHVERGSCPVPATAFEQPRSSSALQAELDAIGKPRLPGKLLTPRN